ncbi:hypothetical protein D3C87_1691820 [compost metagenome]
MEAIGTGQHGEIRVVQFGSGNTTRIAALLVHANGAVHAVIDHDYHQTSVVVCGRRQLLTVHEEATVTGKRHNHALRCSDLGCHRRWNSVTHRAIGWP